LQSGNRHENDHDLQAREQLLTTEDYNAPYFGDLPGKVRSQHFRIGSINLDNLSTNKDDDKHEQLFTAINNYKLDITLMQEVGVNWSAIPQEHGWKKRIDESLDSSQAKSYMGYNKQTINKRGAQWGGTGILSYGKLAHFAMGAGQDIAKLGRWSWTRYRGKQGINLRCISIYRPVDSNGVLSVSTQHKTYLQSHNDDRHPRQAFLEDLEEELQSWIAMGDQIILSGDINDNIFDRHIVELFERHNMTNIIFDRHDPTHAPTTYYRTRSNRIVDGMWATPGITITRGGYLEPGDFPGNHSLIWADISYACALGHNPPTPNRPNARRLQLWNQKCKAKYQARCTQEIRNLNLRHRQTQLINNSTYGVYPTPTQALEANAIDALRKRAMEKAERKCRHLKMGGVGFSEATELPKHTIAFWETAVKRRKGIRISPAHWDRKKHKARITLDTKNLSLETMDAHIQLAKESYRQAKSNHKDERIKFLDTINPKDKDRLIRTERARELGRIAKLINGKLESKSVTMCITNGQEYHAKKDIETILNTINYDKYRQCDDTPFLQEPLCSAFGNLAQLPAADAVLAGTYHPPPLCDPYAKLLLKALKTPSAIIANPTNFSPRSQITPETNLHGWRKAKERTTAGPSNLHFGQFKANAEIPALAALDSSIRTFGYATGFSYSRWQKGTDVQILKRSQDFRAEKQRTIICAEADFNMNNKMLGSDAMRAGERARVFTGDNAGGRKNMRGTEVSMAQRLTNDSIFARRGKAVLMSNDAKGCYDRIAHVVVALALRRLGIPKPAVHSMLLTIQEMDHYIRTAFGDSDTPYRRKPGDPPPQGTLQGNGAGPAGWFAISTILIDMLKQAGYGYTAWTLIRDRAFTITCFAFVDDTDLIHVNNDPNVTTAQLLQEAQANLTMWEGLIRATGGDLAPEKSYWYLLQVVRKNGQWTYESSQNTPGDLYLKQGTYKVKRKEVHEAEEALGIQCRPDGNMHQELAYLKSKITTWCDSVRTKRIHPGDAWYCLNSTIMKTIEYPLMATTFTRQQLDQLMSPLLLTALPKARIQSRLPRKLVYGTLRSRGLDIKDPYVTQLIQHLQAILRHQNRHTPSRHMHEENMDLVQLHVGSELPFWEIPFVQYGCIAPKGWMKHTWEAISETPLTLKGEHITVPSQRQHDHHLTDAFVHHGYTGDDLVALNDCRLYLTGTTTLADICTIEGLHITEAAWTGRVSSDRRTPDWINTYRPGPNKWILWQHALHAIFLQPHSTHRRLRQPLGPWLHRQDDIWKWWVHPSNSNLYSHEDDGTWQQWTASQRRHFHLPQPIQESDMPTAVVRAQVTYHPSSHTAKLCHSCPIVPPPLSPPPTTLADHLETFHPDTHWATRHILTTSTGHTLAAALSNNTAVAVSDGSLKLGFGTAAYVLEGDTSEGRITGVNTVPGPIPEGDSHRCEVSGIYAVVLIVQAITRLHTITSGSITMACDNIQSLQLFDPEYLPDPSHKNFDIVHATWSLVQKSTVNWIGKHVKGHQDKHPHRRLTRLEKLNVEMDTLAKNYWRHQCIHNNGYIPKPLDIPIHGEGWQLWQGTTKVASPNSHALYGSIQDPITQQWWVRHNHIPKDAIDQIDWNITAKYIHDLPLARRRWITKTASHNCGVGETLVLWNHQTEPTCPRCSDNETTTHVYRCQGHDASTKWAESFTNLDNTLTSLHTCPSLHHALLDCISKWRNNDAPTYTDHPTHLHDLLKAQHTIGWQQLLEGLPHKLWRITQHRYYQRHRIRKSSQRWMRTVMQQLHHLAWNQWDHRNHIKHTVLQPVYQAGIQRLNNAIRKEFLLGTRHLLRGDRHHLNINYIVLLQRSVTYRKAWLVTVSHARQRGLRLATGQEAQHGFTTETTSIFNWMKGRPLRPERLEV